MKDSFGRNIDYMRISITDRCNYSCIYCKGKSYMPLKRSEILSFEEIAEVVKNAVCLGIDKFKITGGEPFARKNAINLMENIKNMAGVKQLTVTTNGSLLNKEIIDRLFDIGIDGINFSADTFVKEKYSRITGKDDIEKVSSNILYAYKKGIKIKINTVLIDELDKNDFESLFSFVHDKDIPLRFIELMPMNAGQKKGKYSKKNILEFFSKYENADVKLGNGPCKYIKAKGFKSCIGFIEPIHGKFCSECNRIRLTSTGVIKGCLFYEGKNKIDFSKDIKSQLENAIINKPKKHFFEEKNAEKSMMQIGG